MALLPTGAGEPATAAAVALDIKALQSDSRPPRMYYLDWLRVFLLAFVAFNHTVMLGVLETDGLPGAGYHHGDLRGEEAPGVYGNIHVPIPDAMTYTVGRYLASASLAYNMGLFYLRAGYFSVPSHNKKGPAMFLLDRAIRLGVPLLVWEVLLYPSVLYIGSAGNSLPHINKYQQYFKSYRAVGHLQMWFVTVLFAFDILYVAVRLLHAALQKVADLRATSKLSSPVTDIGLTKSCIIASLASKAAAVLVTALSTAKQLAASSMGGAVSTNHQSTIGFFGTCNMLIFTVLVILVLTASMFVPLAFVGMGWNTLGITLQYSMLGQYAICYCLGTFMYRPRAFNRLPIHYGYWCLGVGMLLYSVVYFVTALFRTSGVCQGLLPALTKPMLSGVPRPGATNENAHCWTAAQLLSTTSTSWMLFDSLVTQAWAVLFSIGLLVVFRQHLNSKPGKFGQLIINASYAFYILFPLVLVSVAKALETVHVHPFAFVAIAWPLTVVGGYVVGVAVRALPGAGRIL